MSFISDSIVDGSASTHMSSWLLLLLVHSDSDCLMLVDNVPGSVIYLRKLSVSVILLYVFAEVLRIVIYLRYLTYLDSVFYTWLLNSFECIWTNFTFWVVSMYGVEINWIRFVLLGCDEVVNFLVNVSNAKNFESKGLNNAYIDLWNFFSIEACPSIHREKGF